QRRLGAAPFQVGGHRHNRAEHDQRDAEHVAPPRDTRKRRQQLDDAEPGHHQRERGPVPGQELPLVGQGEPDVRLLDALFAGLALLVLVVAARGSSPTPPLAGAPMVTPGCGTGVAGYLLGWPLTLTSRPARTRLCSTITGGGAWPWSACAGSAGWARRSPGRGRQRATRPVPACPAGSGPSRASCCWCRW